MEPRRGGSRGDQPEQLFKGNDGDGHEVDGTIYVWT